MLALPRSLRIMLNMPTFQITDQDGKTRKATGPTRDAVIAEANRKKILVTSCVELPPPAPPPPAPPPPEPPADPLVAEVRMLREELQKKTKADVSSAVSDGIARVLFAVVFGPALAIVVLYAMWESLWLLKGPEQIKAESYAIGVIIGTLAAMATCHFARVKKWASRFLIWAAMTALLGSSIAFKLALLRGMHQGF